MAEKTTKPTTKKRKSAKPEQERTSLAKARFLEWFGDISHRCHISDSCRAAGIHRSTFYDWRKADDSFDAACKEKEDSFLDWLEEQLYQAVRDMNITAIIFALCNKGRRRGWQHVAKIQTEYSGPDGEPIKVVMVDESKL